MCAGPAGIWFSNLFLLLPALRFCSAAKQNSAGIAMQCSAASGTLTVRFFSSHSRNLLNLSPGRFSSPFLLHPSTDRVFAHDFFLFLRNIENPLLVALRLHLLPRPIPFPHSIAQRDISSTSSISHRARLLPTIFCGTTLSNHLAAYE